MMIMLVMMFVAMVMIMIVVVPFLGFATTKFLRKLVMSFVEYSVIAFVHNALLKCPIPPGGMCPKYISGRYLNQFQSMIF